MWTPATNTSENYLVINIQPGGNYLEFCSTFAGRNMLVNIAKAPVSWITSSLYVKKGDEVVKMDSITNKYRADDFN